MNINFLNFGINPIQNAQPTRIQGSAKTFEVKKDTFEKNVNFTGINSPDSNWNKARIREIYDKTYEQVIRQNPIVKELNIQKPELLFTFDEWNNEAIAAYTVLLNAIEITNNLKEDCYLITMADKKGKATSPIAFAPESKIGTQQMLYGKNPNVKFIKLNDNEKEKFVSAVLAHEMRHCIQEHLLLSTEGCEDYLASAKEAAKEAQESLNYCIEEDIAAGKRPAKTDREYARCLSYMVNYEPKKILSPDTKLNFSLNPKDKRALSVVRHLLPTAGPDNRINQVNDAYYAQPFEIDAYNYEYEFLNSLIANRSIFDTSRDDVLQALAKLFDGNAQLGIKNMQKSGFAPFDKK